MSFNSRKTQKFPLLVEVHLTDGTCCFGRVFLAPQGRLSDLLNDERHFMPFERSDGVFLALAKAQIKKAAPLGPDAEAYTGENAFRILGVREGASRDDLKRAYRDLSLVHHPDRVRGLGLTGEYLDVATKNMARINEAYDRAVRAMGADGAQGSGQAG